MTLSTSQKNVMPPASIKALYKEGICSKAKTNFSNMANNFYNWEIKEIVSIFRCPFVGRGLQWLGWPLKPRMCLRKNNLV